MIEYIKREYGFTLIELVLIVAIIGILAAVASIKLIPTIETSRYESTKSEMRALTCAITGNPDLFVNGVRSDFGYVGDIGTLPPDLDALASNPGLATWDGPYIKGDVEISDFKKDAWDVDYIYFDTLLRSIGSGTNIDRIFAPSSSSLLNNSVLGYVVDASSDVPGETFRDSVTINLIYPDGSGNMAIVSVSPDALGNFVFSGIPIGNHTLQVIHQPDKDTLSRLVSVVPGSTINMEIRFPADLW